MIFLWDNKIYLFEAIILTCLWPLYIIINICFFKENQQELSESQKENLLQNEKTNEAIAASDLEKK